MHIHVVKTLTSSFKNVWEHKKEWMRVMFAPFVIWIVGVLFLSLMCAILGYPLPFYQALLGQVPPLMMEHLAETQFVIMGGLAKLGFELAYWAALINLMINANRYGVLQEGGDKWWNLHFNKRFWKNICYMILVMACVGVYASAGVGIVAVAHHYFESVVLNVVLGGVLALSAIYVLIRLSFYNLLISIDKLRPLRASWHLLKGNVLRVLGLMFLVGIVFACIFAAGMFALYLLDGVLGWISPTLEGAVAPFAVLLGVLLYFAFWAVYTKAFALIYQTVDEERVA